MEKHMDKNSYGINQNVKLQIEGHFEIGKNVVIEDFVEIIIDTKSSLIIKDNVTIKKFSHINVLNGSTVILENWSHIGMFNLINGVCDIVVGAYTMLGPSVILNSFQHNYENVDKPMRLLGGSAKNLYIGTDCWIGQGSIIMDCIEKKSVIGAGSVVSKKIPAYSVAYGNPAKVRKSRINEDGFKTKQNKINLVKLLYSKIRKWI